MRTNREIRQDAWRLMRTKWLWRLLLVGAVLNLIGQMANQLVRQAYRQMEIRTFEEFLQSKLGALQQGLDYTVPSASAAWQMTGASLFELFIASIFAAIVAFGFAGVALKATAGNESRWFADSFEGFKRPLELAWLTVLMNLLVMLWSLLLIIPGIVALYRYRQAWYLKVENPDWSARQCLAESARLMKGYKWRAFEFDLSYAGWGLLLVATFSAAGVLSVAGGAVSFLSVLVGGLSVYLVLFVFCYFFTGRAAFYRELRKERT